jgi:hypothetical protein
VQSTLLWLETTAKMGAEAVAAVDMPATARWLGDRLGVPGQLIRDTQPTTALLDLTEDLVEVAALDAMESTDDR